MARVRTTPESLNDKLDRVGRERLTAESEAADRMHELRKLARLAHRRGLSKTEIAARAGVSRVTVHEWTKGLSAASRKVPTPSNQTSKREGNRKP